MRVPLDFAPGLNSDDTASSAAPQYIDGCNVRFHNKRPQTIEGWESLVLTLLTGVCRAVLAWTENTSSTMDIALGTHSKLQLYQGGTIFDITPFGPAVALGANPLSVTNASAVVTVGHVAHGIANGTSVLFAGAAAIGGITPNGTFPITVINANSYSYTFTSNATSTVAGGGGSAVVVVPQTVLPAGLVDGTGGSGYGTGAYSTGGYSQPSTSDYFPRTWSLAAWGQKLLASPRNGGLYEWSNNTGTRALAITTAPPQITQLLVSPQGQAFALGCTQENGTYNPLCIRHSDIRDNTQWSTIATSASTAREYILPGGGRIVGGLFLGRDLLVWTTHALFVGTYVGAINQVWRFDRVATKCGLIGPNAATALGSTVFWVGPDKQVRSYTIGGVVAPVACPIWSDFAKNLAPSQGDKIVASSISSRGEVRWDYPDNRDGSENSRYIAVAVEGPDAGSWYRGRTLNGVSSARTAMVDAGPAEYPIGVTPAGNVYWHEKGNSADGGALPWQIETADVALDLDTEMLVQEIWPDIADQQGAVSVTLTTRPEPQGTATVFGPYMVAPGQAKVDDFPKAKGRFARLKYSGNTSPSFARIGRPVAKGKACGRRG